MKIFLVGYHNPSYLTFCEYIERAIEGLGHELAVYDFRDWLIPGRIRDRVPVLQDWDIKRINRNLTAKVKAFKPDVLLITGGWTISPETVSNLKKDCGVVTANWVADFPFMFNIYEKTGPSYDYVFLSGTDALARYEAAGHINGRWLPFACDPDIHRPVNLTAAEYERYQSDICFIGSCYTERIETLEYLTDFNLGIWGPGWERLPENSPLRKCVRGAKVAPEEWNKILSASKIALNILGYQCDVTGPLIEERDSRMTNTRFFELLACRAFQIVNEKADGMTLFKDKEHLCFYKDEKHLKQLLHEYLEKPEERKRIAESGRQEVISKHTYRHRIEKMLSIVSGRSAVEEHNT